MEERKKKSPGGLPLMMFVTLDEGPRVQPGCPKASNPYHKCAHYCRDKISRASKEVGGGESEENRERMGSRMDLLPESINIFSPLHRRVSKDNQTGGGEPEKRKKDVKIKRWNVHPECRYASNPYHICVDKCFDLIYEGDQTSQGRIAEEDKKGTHGAKKLNAQPKCVYESNPYHKCSNYCLRRISKSAKENKKVISSVHKTSNLVLNDKSRNQSSFTLQTTINMQPENINASNQNYENHCQKILEKKEDEEDESEEGKDCMIPSAKKVETIKSNSQSNTCTEHWFQKFTKDQAEKEDSHLQPSSPFPFLLGFIFILVYVVVTAVVGADSDIMKREHRNVHAKCIDATDPGHKSVEGCTERRKNNSVAS